MENSYVEVFFSSVNKKKQTVCGDLVAVERSVGSTCLIVADGMGSGIKANIAAQLTVSRLRELLRLGYSLRDAFRIIVQSLSDARGSELPYAVITVARILNRGVTTVLSYEMPPPVLLYHDYPSVLRMDEFLLGSEIISESEITLGLEDGLFVFSDGVSQAGIGRAFRDGWTSEGVARYLQNIELPYGNQSVKSIIEQARRLDGGQPHDDTTVAFAKFRRGHVLNIFTGPPSSRQSDRSAVGSFLDHPGIKVVCGATTAKIVARELGRNCEMSKMFDSPIEPPAYHIEGIDLVTEGAVTLNQVYNIVQDDLSEQDDRSQVHQLCLFLQICDHINIWVGGATNPANSGLRFRQLGVIPRNELVPLLAERLRNMGKMVVVRDC